MSSKSRKRKIDLVLLPQKKKIINEPITQPSKLNNDIENTDADDIDDNIQNSHYVITESLSCLSLNEIPTNISENLSINLEALFGPFRHTVFEHVFKNKVSPTVNSESSEANIMTWKSNAIMEEEERTYLQMVTKKVISRQPTNNQYAII
ncbi:1033_t:CDS:2 [Dentiscutata heterogama]|uniref:1033_t:CDS:1 n=1 Tax=Dentiscutata heterogama TaxID=1316150 RepID=A0ACA9LLA1_9GLOM|nr:1033_t:CDS:2 [Dentiscutata heterogama]